MFRHPVIMYAILAFAGKVTAEEICYTEPADLGCFNDRPPFGSTPNRPVAHLPWSPEEIGAMFRLYTRYNKYTMQILSYTDQSTISQSSFSAFRNTKVLVHGFNSEGDSNWVMDMKNALIDAQNVNVIVVDWRIGAGASIYGQAAANTRVVGAQIGYLIKTLQEVTGILPWDFHIIGHSLGAHTAGYAGAWLDANNYLQLGRISGMDAAGPYFEGTPAMVRLDSSDARFVDAIHTDGQPITSVAWGINQPVGHVDFYPNGGVDQPGCPGNEVDNGPWWRISCSHSRVHQLYIDSIVNADKPMLGYQCDNYDDFKSGACPAVCPAEGCLTLGYYSDIGADKTETEVLYYLYTGSEAPFSHN